MIELKHDSLPPQTGNDLDELQKRVTSRRHKYRQLSYSTDSVRSKVSLLLTSPSQYLRSLPSRYLLHAVVVLLVPLALLLGQFALRPVPQPLGQNSRSPGDIPLALGPVNLNQQVDPGVEAGIIGDLPLDGDDSMPMPLSLASRSETMASPVFPATIGGDVVKVRNGPGLDYDETGRLNGGIAVQVLGRSGDWLQIREALDKPVIWVSGELVNMADAMRPNVPEVPRELIPPPPPPKVGMVRETKLNLRDGPGTNYISMSSLKSGQQVTLIQQYQDWLFVDSGDLNGWVKTEFLDIAPNIIERVPAATSIPDPNPALVGLVSENQVNLRRGPSSDYERVDRVNAGAEVSLLARHKDWYRVEYASGKKAWIFSDLLQVSPMVQRRVPVTNDIPALPTRNPVAAAPSRSSSAPSANLASIAASGDVAGYALQFVGSRYVYGGASPRGFDCSGLMYYVYGQFGVRLPRTAASQFNTAYGASVGSMNNLQPGDLVFFVRTARGGGITHVAMYVGGGRIVHAMTPGLGVQVSNLWDSYWVSHYYGGLRVRR